MKKVIVSSVIVLVLLSSLVSAGIVSDIFGKITGKLAYHLRCYDSDNGNEPLLRGQAQDGKGGSGIDHCVDGQLREYWCDMNVLEVKWEVMDCPGGHYCKNGACVEKEKRYDTSALDKKESVMLVLGEEESFGFDSLVLNMLSDGEADIVYTKKVRVKDGDMVVFGNSKFEIAVNGENVELVNRGSNVEVVVKEVEKVVYPEEEEEEEKPGFFKRLFGWF